MVRCRVVDDVEAELVAHPESSESAKRLTATDVAAWQAEEPDLQIVDIRGPGEVDATGWSERSLPL